MFDLVLGHRFCVFAFGITRAGKEFSETAGADDHFPSALVAKYVAFDHRDFDPFALQRIFGFLIQRVKILVEVTDGIDPAAFARADLVELLFKSRREFHFHDLVKILHHQIGDHQAERCGFQGFLFAFDIIAAHDIGEDRRVGGRSADSVFVQCFDECRFSVARGRLCEMLIGGEFFQFQNIAVIHFGQRDTVFGLFVPSLFVKNGIAVKLYGIAARLEEIIVCRDIHIHGILYASRHHGSDKPLPNQFVKFVLIHGQRASDPVGGQGHIGRADRFVSVLRAAFTFEIPRRRRQIRRAVTGADISACRRARLFGNTQRVGTHVGDQTRRAHTGDLHAFIKLLGDPHGALSRKAEFAGRLLL